jgi:serine/threonine protein kinase
MDRKLRQPEPRRMGDYDLLETIGKGSMGAVYKGRHRTTGDLVAIKTASAAVVDHPVLRQRFEREFRAAIALDHPHIVRALDCGQEGAVPFLVMEYVDGETLGRRLAAGKRLSEAEAVRLGTQAAQALHAAHQKGIIHRDVKPDNLLLSADGRVKLTDLGLVKELDADMELTRTRTVLGTPNFMAPEQFADSKTVDKRCDIYSLAATLYMAVTGRLPFQARGTLSMLQKKLKHEITPPRELVPGLSERFERAILRALNPEPQQRQATCLEFIDDLTGGRAVANPPAGAAKSAGRNRRATLRYPANLESDFRPLRGAKKATWRAKVRDVSARGVGLLANRRFEPGTVLIVEIKDAQGGTDRMLLVRVVRVVEESLRKWVLGCEQCRELGTDEVQAMLS